MLILDIPRQLAAEIWTSGFIPMNTSRKFKLVSSYAPAGDPKAIPRRPACPAGRLGMLRDEKC